MGKGRLSTVGLDKWSEEFVSCQQIDRLIRGALELVKTMQPNPDVGPILTNLERAKLANDNAMAKRKVAKAEEPLW
jgi:hypothetical protein